MALTQVSNGTQPSVTDYLQIYSVLQQTNGGQEKGKYHCAGNSYIASGDISIYIPSLSRGATPVSVTLDTADQAPVGMTTPTTLLIGTAGFQILGQTSAITTTCNVGGNYTLQY